MTTGEIDGDEAREPNRRVLLKAATFMTASALISMVPPAVRSSAWAAGSDAPEKREVRIGFIPLTDCSSVVMAAAMQFDRKYGLKIVPSKEASWASVRDKLVSGANDASHALYGLIYGVHLGIGGPRKDMAILATLNHNGQAITLSNKLRSRGVRDGAGLKRLLDAEPGEYTFAHTFPTGTHALWLNYWLAAHGIDPLADVRTITVPPPQMVASMRDGRMDGFCVGEPWNNRAIVDALGFTAETTQAIWPDHPEKVLGTTAQFVRDFPNTARAMTAAIIDAGRWIDASAANRERTAETVASSAFIDTDKDVILARMQGRYENGLGRAWRDAHPMRFYNDGRVPLPYLSDGMWFMTQQRRWGLLRNDPDYLAVAAAVQRIDICRQAADAAKASVADTPMRSARLIDGVVWDGADPARYALGASIHA